MKLPYSEELNIEYLGRLFDNTSECYKFFWFKAIVAKVIEGKCELTYEELCSLSTDVKIHRHLKCCVSQIRLFRFRCNIRFKTPCCKCMSETMERERFHLLNKFLA